MYNFSLEKNRKKRKSKQVAATVACITLVSCTMTVDSGCLFVFSYHLDP